MQGVNLHTTILNQEICCWHTIYNEIAHGLKILKTMKVSQKISMWRHKNEELSISLLEGFSFPLILSKALRMTSEFFWGTFFVFENIYLVFIYITLFPSFGIPPPKKIKKKIGVREMCMQCNELQITISSFPPTGWRNWTIN